jgi:hypothetical protein
MIVGLVGPKTSGKTTVFEMTQNKVPGIEEVMLAKQLKRVCAIMLAADSLEFNSQKYKETNICLTLNRVDIDFILDAFNLDQYREVCYKLHVGKTLHSPRELMQYVGTNILRSIRPSIHIEYATSKIVPGRNYMVTDIRFFDELLHFMRKTEFPQFKAYYLYRPEAEKVAKLPDAHESEKNTLWLREHVNVVLLNTGSLEELEEEVDRFIIPNFRKGE